MKVETIVDKICLLKPAWSEDGWDAALLSALGVTACGLGVLLGCALSRRAT